MTSTYTRTAQHRPGDVLQDADGLAIITPRGEWHLTDEQILDLAANLTHSLRDRLSRPWSRSDNSTILHRGRRS